MSTKTVEGVLITYKAGAEIGRERFHDDGERLVSEIPAHRRAEGGPS